MKSSLAVLLSSIIPALSAPAQGQRPVRAEQANAAGRPVVEVAADLIELFKPGLVQDALSCEVRQPASAGGVKQDALFEHPLAVGRPARVNYELDLTRTTAQEPLLLAFEIALSDGIKSGAGADGVRFVVQINGRQMFSAETVETRWQPHVVDLTEFAGQHVRLTLATDARNNTSYDWALWGNPRILAFHRVASKKLPPDLVADAVIAAPTGAVGVKAARPFKLRVIPDSAEPPVEINGAAQNEPQWFVGDFSFTNAGQVRVEWEPKDAFRRSDVLLGGYAPLLKFTQFSADRAIVQSGDPVLLHVEMKNGGRGTLLPGKARIQLRIGNDAQSPRALPRLATGETWRAEWSWRAPDKTGAVAVSAELMQPGPTEQLTSKLDIFAPPKPRQDAIVGNDQVRLEFVRQRGGFAYAKILFHEATGWTPVAVWSPLLRIVTDTGSDEQSFEIHPRRALLSKGRNDSVEFVQTQRDADGVSWEARLRVTVEPDRPVARVHYEYKPSRPRKVRALSGLNIYVGDGTSGAVKTWGLFPGLEYLFGAEPSSNPRDFAPKLADRRTPDARKITVPLMAITVGPDSQSPPENPARFFTPDSLKDQILAGTANPKSPASNLKSDVTVALFWNPLQRWDGEHAFPSARFASPNLDEGMANHHLALFLPSTPDFVPENAGRANRTYELAADKAITLDANLVVASGPVNAALREYLRETGGLPNPHPWPRDFQPELDVCRAGFLKTLWNGKTDRWSHCIGWAGSHAPGFAALLWLDSLVAEKSEARRQSRERVELAAQNMLRDGGPELLTSQANCHIMQWEFPFYYGYLPEALASLEPQIQNLIQSQRPDGGWHYEPANAQQADLGRAGDSVLGTCANRAATLLRYARITGDATALATGEKALRFMENFRVPRGGQTWECPMYEPDILAAAYAIRAYHDGYRATGDPRWLHDAVYWAESGVPFIYLWSLPDKPMMLGATIPVFGSTFYTHSWLAMPVQWCGLVYAYHVFHLARELQHTPLPETGSTLPLALNFSPADWRQIVELITVSGTYQQFADGEKIGAYPDSISQFEKRNPAFINPEDILVNVLALQGFDPDIKTARLRRANDTIVVSSGAEIENLEATGDGIRFKLNYFSGESSQSLIAGLKPNQVLVDGAPLLQSANPVRRDPGWWWDQMHQRTYLVVPHQKKSVSVEVSNAR
ncbi:MAG TPA: hypothetical protein VN887_15300 [Candidatus Angelobacter sp.]|nr:hypothetical protein [Candidatus Angelobacter sp.]